LNSKSSFSAFLLAAYFWTAILFLVFPIFVIIPISFGESQFLRFPPEEIGLRWYRAYFSDPVWVEATLLSLKIGLFASLIATFTGTLAVLALERHIRVGRAALTYVITSPIIIPHIFIALGVFIFAVRFGFTNSEIALVGAHSMVAMPFVVLIVGASLRQIDPTIERAARVLGAGPIRAFFTATFPSLLPAIVAAGVFAFFVSFDELIIAQFLLSGKETLPMRIWADLQLDISPTVAAVASLLIVVTTIAMVIAETLRRRAARNFDETK
jgi:ABC-type spermidine/putrescine transport system permease subunit II